MGIVNVTPDSFSDGGSFFREQDAVDHGMRLVDQGAGILDVGGESTRPGSQGVDAREECRRVLGVIEQLARRCSAVISVDTSKSEVARRALDAGASWVNDVSAGRFDAGMPALVAQRRCPVLLMHSRARPQTMQHSPRYDDVVGEVCDELQAAVQVFVQAGVGKECILLDPGIGFAKRVEDNCCLLTSIGDVVGMGYPVVLGVSRKSFLGALTGRDEPRERLAAGLAAVVMTYVQGVRIFRVHDVAATVDALTVAAKLLGERVGSRYTP